jgi:protein AbiQ
MRYIFLSEQFYSQFDKRQFPEILGKSGRPFIMLLLQIENLNFAIPFRSRISHKFAFFTNSPKGIDYTKAVILLKKEYYYIPINRPIMITQEEHEKLFNAKRTIILQFSKYVKEYKNAIINKTKRRALYQYSTLQYFHDELKIQQSDINTMK